MKILSLTTEIQRDLTNSGTKLKQATTTGYSIAIRNAKIYKLGNTHKYLNITRSVGDKILKNTTRKELPYIAGAIGLLIPMPLVSPILMGLGFLFSFCIGKQCKNEKSENKLIANNLDTQQ